LRVRLQRQGGRPRDWEGRDLEGVIQQRREFDLAVTGACYSYFGLHIAARFSTRHCNPPEAVIQGRLGAMQNNE
jgi:hypothetical protein